MLLVTLQFPIFLPRDLPSQFLKGGQQLEGKINLEQNEVLSSRAAFRLRLFKYTIPHWREEQKENEF